MILSIANYEYCMYRRQIEKAGMKRAVQIMQEKKTKEKAMEESAKIKREERRKAKEEADREEERKRKSSWKFW
jgi:cytochrome c oxidase assembly protein subunit 20